MPLGNANVVRHLPLGGLAALDWFVSQHIRNELVQSALVIPSGPRRS